MVTDFIPVNLHSKTLREKFFSRAYKIQYDISLTFPCLPMPSLLFTFCWPPYPPT